MIEDLLKLLGKIERHNAGKRVYFSTHDIALIKTLIDEYSE